MYASLLGFILLLTSPPRFLIEGPEGAVLHTGDFRAEPWFIQSLTKNPFLQRYIYTLSNSVSFAGNEENSLEDTLHAIYLDTACLLGVDEVPTKVGLFFYQTLPIFKQ